MTTEQRLERFEELDRKLTELMATVVGMVQRQEEMLDRGRKMLNDQRERTDEEDLDGDGG